MAPSASDSDSMLDKFESSLHNKVETVAPGLRFERCSLPPKDAEACAREGWMIAIKSPESTVGLVEYGSPHMLAGVLILAEASAPAYEDGLRSPSLSIKTAEYDFFCRYCDLYARKWLLFWLEALYTLFGYSVARHMA
jgi:hypothetical protein